MAKIGNVSVAKLSETLHVFRKHYTNPEVGNEKVSSKQMGDLIRKSKFQDISLQF